MQSSTRLSQVCGKLYPVAPFDFEKSLQFICGFEPTKGEQLIEGSQMVKSFSVHRQPVVVELTSDGEVDTPAIRYDIFSKEELAPETLEAALDRIRFFLSMDDDLKAFYKLAEEDSAFSQVIHQLYGYHQVKFMSPFENACWAVLVQRNPILIAQKLKQKLYERYGDVIEVRGKTYRTFPEPSQLAAADYEELCGLVGEKRGTYLHAVGEAFARIDESYLRTGSYDEIVEWLKSIKGIGDWSAQFVLIRGLGRMNRVPLDEKNIIKAASFHYNNGYPLTAGEVKTLADRYGEYQGYWAHYLRVN